MFSTDERTWSREVFGGCQLGDARRTQRLVDMGARLASLTGESMAKCCRGAPAAQLGSYRFLRNAAVNADRIAEGGFDAAVRQARKASRLLALEDTTTLNYRHQVADDLGLIGSDATSKSRGYLVHSVLLVDSATERTAGLVEQQHWCRDPAEHGKKHARKQRTYADKESFKWQRASERMSQRLGATMAQVISVCDRESDVYGYLRYKLEHAQRFVVRASVDRCVQGSAEHVFATLEDQARELGHKTVAVPQRGGRKARKATLVLRAMALQLSAPQRADVASPALPVHAVVAQEVDAPDGVQPLCWRLLTSEPIDDLAAVQRVVRDYELRWRIEEYHKAWKSGVGVERQRLQRAANLERMLVITAFVAVRLLQLREAVGGSVRKDRERDDAREEPTVLEPDEWRMLWVSIERSPPPAQTPSARWAYGALAKLGGFTDTKRTGRPGWSTLWDGWFYLQERLAGYRLSLQMAGKM